MRAVRRVRWWVRKVAVLGALLPILPPGPAAAQTTLQVEAGYAGAYVPGQPVPVRVGVLVDRLVQARLEVAVGRSTPVEMAVEVPGGGRKLFTVVVSTAVEQSPVVTARLRQGGRVVAAGEGQLRSSTDEELVGLLPGVLRGRPVPGPAALAVDAGTARFAAVGESDLEAAPAGLGPLSTLGLDTDELAGLSPGARAGVLSWVGGGGRLLVDAERGRTVPGLPDGWQPGGRGRAGAGLGEVVATAGAMAAGRWANLVEPTARGSTSFRGQGDVSVASSLAAEAGLRSPRLGWLVGFLVVYVVAVGPVLFLALRRRRRSELAWVAVPLVALVFSSASYAVGRNLRQATQLVHATVLSSGPAGATATSYLGVFSRGGETARIGFPAGWSTLTFAGGDSRFAGATGVVLTPDGPEARIPLDAGQFAMVAGTGAAPGAGSLEVSAATDAGGRVTGKVRNQTNFSLQEVAVLAGSGGALVGRLAPGEEREWTVSDPTIPGQGAEFALWANLGMGDPNRLVDPGLWQATTQAGGSKVASSGTVVAAGWTRDYTPTVRAGGGTARPRGRTVLVSRAPVRLGAATDPLDAAVGQELVRDPSNKAFPPGDRTASSVMRFTLPTDGPAPALVLRSPFPSAEFWQDGAWRPAVCVGDCRGQAGAVVSGQFPCPANGPCPPPPLPFRGFVEFSGPGATIPVPDGAVRDGVVYARVPGPASPGNGVQMYLSRAGAP